MVSEWSSILDQTNQSSNTKEKRKQIKKKTFQTEKDYEKAKDLIETYNIGNRKTMNDFSNNISNINAHKQYINQSVPNSSRSVNTYIFKEIEIQSKKKNYLAHKANNFVQKIMTDELVYARKEEAQSNWNYLQQQRKLRQQYNLANEVQKKHLRLLSENSYNQLKDKLASNNTSIDQSGFKDILEKNKFREIQQNITQSKIIQARHLQTERDKIHNIMTQYQTGVFTKNKENVKKVQQQKDKLQQIKTQYKDEFSHDMWIEKHKRKQLDQMLNQKRQNETDQLINESKVEAKILGEQISTMNQTLVVAKDKVNYDDWFQKGQNNVKKSKKKEKPFDVQDVFNSYLSSGKVPTYKTAKNICFGMNGILQ